MGAVLSGPVRPIISLPILLVLAVVFGGGGANFGFLNLVVQIAALVVLALHQYDIGVFWCRLTKAQRALVVATIGLPILQALPLPPSIWQDLPGRDLVIESLEVAGVGREWFPVSIDWRRTLLAGSALIVPFAALVLAALLEKEETVRLLYVVVGLGVLSFLLGSVQILTGNEVLSWYPNRDPGELYGFFANRNSAGLFFVIAFIAVVAVKGDLRNKSSLRYAYYPLVVVFCLGGVLTQSRSSTALLLIPLSFFAAREFVVLREWGRKAGRGIAAVASLAVVSFVYLAFSNEKLGQTLSRFDDTENLRWSIWSDSIPAIAHYWPFGSGMGTFRETSEVFESLEAVNPLTAGRAHNDYLELALEGGVFALILLLGWIASVMVAYQRARVNSDRRQVWEGAACILALLAMALQSLIDYPLRNQALLCIAGVLTGMLLTYSRQAKRVAGEP